MIIKIIKKILKKVDWFLFRFVKFLISLFYLSSLASLYFFDSFGYFTPMAVFVLSFWFMYAISLSYNRKYYFTIVVGLLVLFLLDVAFNYSFFIYSYYWFIVLVQFILFYNFANFTTHMAWVTLIPIFKFIFIVIVFIIVYPFSLVNWPFIVIFFFILKFLFFFLLPSILFYYSYTHFKNKEIIGDNFMPIQKNFYTWFMHIYWKIRLFFRYIIVNYIEPVCILILRLGYILVIDYFFYESIIISDLLPGAAVLYFIYIFHEYDDDASESMLHGDTVFKHLLATIANLFIYSFFFFKYYFTDLRRIYNKFYKLNYPYVWDFLFIFFVYFPSIYAILWTLIEILYHLHYL